jgi:hypothetical protein
MKIEEVQTRVKKGFDGWEAQTIRTEKGQTFDISTHKNYSGNLTTTVRKVTVNASGSGMMGINYGTILGDEPFLKINHGKLRITENVIREAHFKGLAAFDQKVTEMPEEQVKDEVFELYDICFLDGYDKSKGDHGNNWIIYKIEESSFGPNVWCVEKDTLDLQRHDYLRPISKKFGIGMYFEKGYNMQSFGIDQDQLSNMLIEAQELAVKQAAERKIKEDEAAVKAAERQKYLSQFIRADRRTTTNIIKAHCMKSFKIAKIEVKTDSFSGGDSMDVVYYSPEPIKELEAFIDTFCEGHFNGMIDMYEDYEDREAIIMDGHILQTYKYTHARHEEAELPEPKPEAIVEIDEWDELFEKPKANIQIIEYSEKAIAVIGETKPIKDELKALGGRFNFRLHCGAGWIFPTAKRSAIEKLIA